MYENTRVLEWLRFWQLGGLTFGGVFAIFIPWNVLFKTNLITDTADELMFTQYHLVSPAGIDLMRVGIPIGTLSIGYTVYALMNGLNMLTSQYIVKMTYSKDKVKN